MFQSPLEGAAVTVVVVVVVTQTEGEGDAEVPLEKAGAASSADRVLI